MRQLTTNRQTIREISQSIAQPKIRQGFLVENYLGYAEQVMIQLTDPQHGTRGTVFKAQLRSGLILPQIAAGSSVTIRINHGQVEVIGL